MKIRIIYCSARSLQMVTECYCNRLMFHRPKNFLAPLSMPLSQPLHSFARSKATYTVQNAPNKGIFNKIVKKLGWFSISRSKLKRSGYYLYESVADNLNYNTFFKEFDMEDTFFSWFLITELHVWMISVRVMAEGEEGKFVRNNIIEAMWADVNNRAKRLGDPSSSFLRQNMTELSEQFQAAIVGYDEGILSEDRVLAGAIWRRFFKQECSDPEKIECLVKYVRKQLNVLDELPPEKVLFSPSVTWIPLQRIEDTLQ